MVASVIAAGTLVGLSHAAGAVPVPFKNCGTSGDPITITQFDASVWPPQAGQAITLTYRWNLSVQINPGAFRLVTATLPSGRQISARRPLIPPLLPVPIPAGPRTFTATLMVPPGFPSGSAFSFHDVMFNANGTRLACMDLTVPIK